jgi:hypothetical protein
MNSQSSEVSPEAMQARIQQARREAETLKDRIKRKKDELADTTRTSPVAMLLVARVAQLTAISSPLIFVVLTQPPSRLQSAPLLSRLTSLSPRTS